MSHAPYNDAGKFDAVGEDFYKLSQAVLFLSNDKLSTEQREKESKAAIAALKNLGSQFSSILKDFDKRLHKIEHSK